MKTQERFTELLRQKRLKTTPQRLAMLRILHERGHADIDHIYQEIKKEFLSVSLATVYKNVHTMLEAGLIEEIRIPRHKSRYEISKERHGHFLCQRCGELYDVPQPSQLDLSLPEGFVADTFLVMAKGVCAKCATNL